MLTFAFGAIGLVVYTAILLWIKDRQLRRLNGIVMKLRNEGMIDLSIELSPQAPAQLRHVTRTIDQLTYALNAIVLDIVAASKKFSLFSSDIYYSGQQLSQLSDQQAQFVQAILVNAERFHQAMSGLVEQINHSLAHMQFTAARYEALRAQTATADARLAPLTEATVAAGRQAAIGSERMDRSLQSTAQLSRAIAELNGKVAAMQQRTAQIGKVLVGVQDIADTTHVLATNASIEAARAGSAGKGFAVIAAEIRRLSQNSRGAIDEVVAFLQQTAADIRDSAQIAADSAAGVVQVEALAAETGQSLRDITERVQHVSAAMTAFQDMFGQQQSTIQETLDQAALLHSAVEAIAGDAGRQAEGYAEIQKNVQNAAEGAKGAAHSARVLSQLGTYLRTGGQELSHIVDTFTVSEPRFMQGIQRKEPRTTLLYNLEIFRDGELIGHLGDISPSGMLLLSENSLPEGVPQEACIHLPLSFGNLPDVPIRFVPRRTVKQAWFYKIGCSIDTTNSIASKEGIEMIIRDYTVTHGLDPNEFSPAAPAAPAAPTARDGDEGDDDDDVQELEEV